MAWSNVLRFVVSVLAVTLLLLVLVTLLPHDKFLRYQALNDGQAPTAYWVYERIEHDPTPIDVAFIGTSRTGFAVHSARLQQDLADRGIDAHVANLHIVKMGRNMQFVIAKELMEHKHVQVLFLEVDDLEDRSPHPDFIYLADSIDVVRAPLFINFRYFSDLARLPGRQLGLFFDTELDELHWSKPDWLPPAYEGEHFDHAQFIVTLDGKRHDRGDHFTVAEMQKLQAQEDANVTPDLLPPSLNWLEYRVPRYYVEKILTLAAAKGTRVVFLYLPRYGAPAQCLVCERLYAGRAPIVNPWGQTQRSDLWEDGDHMNWDGAKRVTDYVASQIVGEQLLQAPHTAAPTAAP